MNTQGKLLISAFIVILLGIVLIQPIADDVEEVSVYSIVVTNETVALSNVLATVSNETLILYNSSYGNLTYFNISSITEIRNMSSDVITTAECNITLATGAVKCNVTVTDDSNVTYWDYIYVSGNIGTLANTDEILSLDALRNESSTDITGWCNFTISTGGLACNNTGSFTGYADYQYDTDLYVRSRAARTILNLTILFFALFVLVIAAGFTWKALKEAGVI